MKKIIGCLVGMMIILSISSCVPALATSPPAPSEDTHEQDARQALVEFFRLLHDGRYQQAAGLYAGSYQWLIDSNPDISPSDTAALLERGCRQNGLMCLEVRSSAVVLMTYPTGYLFRVEFNLDDGTLFVLGPCCGADETEMPPVSTFQYQVLQGEKGSWGVADLPPYVP